MAFDSAVEEKAFGDIRELDISEVDQVNGGVLVVIAAVVVVVALVWVAGYAVGYHTNRDQ